MIILENNLINSADKKMSWGEEKRLFVVSAWKGKLRTSLANSILIYSFPKFCSSIYSTLRNMRKSSTF